MLRLYGKRLYLEFSQYNEESHNIYFNVHLNNGIFIGKIILQNIDWINRSASIGMTIDSHQYRGSGYGTEAGQALLDYGFNRLGLARIEAETMEYNIGGQRSLEKIGLIYEGRGKNKGIYNGKICDRLYYGLLREEFNKKFNNKM